LRAAIPISCRRGFRNCEELDAVYGEKIVSSGHAVLQKLNSDVVGVRLDFPRLPKARLISAPVFRI
jgi:hypothetical protein